MEEKEFQQQAQMVVSQMFDESREQVRYVVSSADVVSFLDSPMWQDMRAFLICYREIMRNELENGYNLTEAQIKGLQEGLRVVRHMEELPEVMRDEILQTNQARENSND